MANTPKLNRHVARGQVQDVVRGPSQNALMDTLEQLLTVTWDGNLASKDTRDWLVTQGLAWRHNGYNGLTIAGVEYLTSRGLLVP